MGHCGRSAVVLVLVLAAGLTAGCGATTSRSAFVRRATAICRSPRDRLGSLMPPSDLRSVLALMDDEIAAHRALLAHLRPLRPPASQRTDVRRLLAIAGRQLTVVASQRRALAAADHDAAQRLGARSLDLSRRTSALEQRLGLAGCLRY